MFSTQEMVFAQKYPFSEIAKSIVKKSDLQLQDVTREVRSRAQAILSATLEQKPYKPKVSSSRELLMNEILAYPIAKIYVSALSSTETGRKFSKLIANTTFNRLIKEKDSVIFDLANELAIKFNALDNNFFASMSLFDFLKVHFFEDYMKLVNQRLSNGKIYLNRNEFIRFVSGFVFEQLHNSFPLDIKNVPRYLKDEAKQFHEEKLSSVSFNVFSRGKFSDINPEFFSPCFVDLYTKAFSGQPVTHIARFDLATFLAALGMPAEKIKELFKNTPNYDEKKTSYHVSKLFSKGEPLYGPPSCAKMKEHALCNADCNVKNPIIYYRRKASANNPKKKRSYKK